jgi:hypothetical protein
MKLNLDRKEKNEGRMKEGGNAEKQQNTNQIAIT